MAKEKLIGIYSITNKINGKIYIGQSIDISHRWTVHKSHFNKGTHHNVYFQRAWDKYGQDNFEFNIVEKCISSELNSKEIYWIEKHNSNNNNLGYNLTFGGDANTELTDDLREIYRQCQEAIPIIQLNFDGEVIEIWKHGCREASKKLTYSQSNIWKSCNKVQPSYKGFIWLYLSEYESMGVDTYWHEKNSRFKRIVQLDVDTFEIVKIWNRLKDINTYHSEMDTSCITKVCKNKIASSYGYRWMYYVDFLQGDRNVKCTNTKRVNKVFNGEVINTYFSVIEASRDINGWESSIRKAIYNKIKYLGYDWEYV